MDIVTRAMGVLMDPKKEWGTIAGESSDPGKIYVGYVIPLAAAQAVAVIIGWLLFVGAVFGFGVQLAIVRLIEMLVMVGVVGFAAAKLAPMFGGKDDLTQGLKLVAYSLTPALVAGIVFGLLPFLFVYLGFVARLIMLAAMLYGLYILYLGTTPVMGVAGDKSIIYLVALVVAVAVVMIVIGFILSAVGMGNMSSTMMMRGM